MACVVPEHIIKELLATPVGLEGFISGGPEYELLPSGGMAFDFSDQPKAQSQLLESVFKLPSVAEKKEAQYRLGARRRQQGVPEDEIKYQYFPAFWGLPRLPVPGSGQAWRDSRSRTRSFPAPDVLGHLADMEDEKYFEVVIAQTAPFGIESWQGVVGRELPRTMSPECVDVWIRASRSATGEVHSRVDSLLKSWWEGLGKDANGISSVATPMFAGFVPEQIYSGPARLLDEKRSSLRKEMVASLRAMDVKAQLAYGKEMMLVGAKLRELVSLHPELSEERANYHGQGVGVHCQVAFTDPGPVAYWDLVARLVTFSETVEPLQFVMFS